MGFSVTAPYITVRSGGRVVGLMEGAVLPPDVPDWNIKHLLANDLIADTAAAEDAVAARPGEPTGAHGRAALPMDRLPEEGGPGNPYLTSGATTVDPEYAARVRRQGVKATAPEPSDHGVLSPREQLDAAERHAERQAAAADQAKQLEVPAPERPAVSAPKADWVEYAVGQGAARTEAEASSKEKLVGQYGGR